MLLDTIQKTNAEIVILGQQVATHLGAAANHANRMVSAVLGLSDADLTTWLNSHNPQEIGELFGAHKLLGDALNSSAAVANSILAQSGMATQSTPVDVRPVADKLAAMNRVLTFENGVFAVTTVVPQPEPEPQPE
jgi:hypothetical protein